MNIVKFQGAAKNDLILKVLRFFRAMKTKGDNIVFLIDIENIDNTSEKD